MPYLKCAACRTRLKMRDVQADPLGESCPGCGEALQPVAHLDEIVSFRSVCLEGGPPTPSMQRPAGEDLVDRVAQLMSARDAGRALNDSPAESWLRPDLDFPQAAAAALPRPPTGGTT